ncbi:DMT family transporter [Teichococcus cervicalis]|uniref:Putative membrane protein n=1 Tax=Pseudoroseomonas cervicalis ATCC 49957 TaxID=525371 RepID=D5RP94_9PROT|nr:DMT family transporter [Pseudoroseomonas cervicalis]EFH10878.1 putative membrane protein [Pseudoroseomonas cervicalis ATCC 49957]
MSADSTALPAALPPRPAPPPAPHGVPGRERAIGLACAFAVVLVWSGFALSGRLSARQAFTPWDVGALRYAGSLLAGLALAWRFGWPRLPLYQIAGLTAGAAFGFPLAAYWGFSYAPAAHAGVLLTGMLPFITALLAALWLGEGFSRQRLLSLGVVAGGIALLASDTFAAYPGAWRGDLLFLAGSFSWAVFTVLLRRWRVPAITATTVLALYPPFLYLPLWALFLPSQLAEAAPGAIAYQFVYQGFIAVVVAGFLFSRAVVAIGGALTTTITALTPALSALAAWPLLGEALGPLGLAGVALVSLGMALGVLRGR